MENIFGLPVKNEKSNKSFVVKYWREVKIESEKERARERERERQTESEAKWKKRNTLSLNAFALFQWEGMGHEEGYA